MNWFDDLKYKHPQWGVAFDAVEEKWGTITYQLDSEGEVAMSGDDEKLIDDRSEEIAKAFLEQFDNCSDEIMSLYKELKSEAKKRLRYFVKSIA